MNALATTGSADLSIWFFVAMGIAAIPTFVLVHMLLNRVCFGHVRRYCSAHHIKISDSHISPQFDEKGTKTERTIIHILSDSGERKIYTFVVWAFGIKEVRERPFDPKTDQPSPNGA